MTRTTSRDSVTVEGVEPGALLPSTRDDIGKTLELDGRKIPFQVRGGAYARELRARGSGLVRGPVLTSGSATIEVPRPHLQRYLGGLSASGSISASCQDGEPGTPAGSPATDVRGIRLVVRGDLNAGTGVELENALVVGGITAPSIDLANSIVLGHVRAYGAPGHLRAVCCTLSSFEVEKLTLEGPTGFVLAAGISASEPHLRDHEDTDGKVWPFAIRHLSLCRHKAIGCGLPNRPLHPEGRPDIAEAETSTPGLCCGLWARATCPHVPGISLTRGDFVPMTGSREEPDSREPEEGTSNPAPASPAVRWTFGLERRILRAQPLAESDAVFDDALHHVFAYEHLSPKHRLRLRELLDSRKLSDQEARILGMAIQEAGAAPDE